MNIFEFNPWIRTRKHLIILKFSDFFIINILNILSSKQFAIFHIITYSILWILVSYFLGRYHSLLESKINFKRYIVKSILSIPILIFLSKLLIPFFDEILPLRYLIFYIINSSLFLVPICIGIKNFLNHKNNWYFLGNKGIFQTLISCDDLSKRNYKIIYKEINEIISQKKSVHDYGIIIENLEFISSSDFIKLKSIGYSIIPLINWYQIYLNRFPVSFIEKNHLISIKNKRQINFQNHLKRLGDVILSLIILLAISPIILFVCVLIMLEDFESPFYSQERTGFKGSRFKILKLRTMIKNAEKEGAVWSKNNDNRITKVGKILRKTRIDEIPQLISVIRGDMSLIGPRPERPEIDEILYTKINNYDLRYLSKPGLSGWAQVNYPYGASIKDSEYKLSYDYYYQLNQNILLDIVILLKTIKLIINLEGAIAKK